MDPNATRSRLTADERAARGRAARSQAPRSSHSAWAPSPARPDPIALLEEQAETRVPELVPVRYGRMLVSPFAFYRGAALIMTSDLSTGRRSGLMSQVCGDAHLSNFGLFGSPERQMLFDINDFDETLPGPWEWDVMRLAASFEVAGRERGFPAADRRAMVTTAVASYRNWLLAAAQKRNLEVWYDHVEVSQLRELLTEYGSPKLMKRAERGVAKARTKDSMQAFEKLTHLVDGQRRIIAEPPLIVPLRDLVRPGTEFDQVEADLRGLIRSYRRTLQSDRRHLLQDFQLVDAAHKVVGVGSVGMRAWILLLLGRDGEDPLFLQAKEAQPSVLERFVGRSRYANCGQRVVAGQQLMQAASDIFLGWQRATGLDGRPRDFYVRQLRDWKGSLDVDAVPMPAMTLFAQLCGSTLARAHARSGDRIAIAAYLGRSDVFDRAIADFAHTYAEQNEQDYQALVAAVGSGRVHAETGL